MARTKEKFSEVVVRVPLQRRFVLRMAMLILSVAMVSHLCGVPSLASDRPAYLNPMRVWSRAEEKLILTKNRVIGYYENARLVYGIALELKDLEEQADGSGRICQRRHTPTDMRSQGQFAGSPLRLAVPATPADRS